MAAVAAAGGERSSAILTKMIEELAEAEETAEIRFKIDQSHPDIPSGGFKEYGQKVMAALEEAVAADEELKKAPVNYEGVRISGYGGWFLLRLSLHDPVLPLNLEGPSKASVQSLGKVVLHVVEKFPALSIQPLLSYLASLS
eukprot:TRINITY_DN2873_c0_g1_i2.p1 TRINITY_DN2873_c0_g1~~TRINITY_DN2873_c0_g1_i2.p1  ORF type:complete len:159 (+),score=58.90 TRINITY_DN2873_c0_g1_i2:53-478(+)